MKTNLFYSNDVCTGDSRYQIKSSNPSLRAVFCLNTMLSHSQSYMFTVWSLRDEFCQPPVQVQNAVVEKVCVVVVVYGVVVVVDAVV